MYDEAKASQRAAEDFREPAGGASGAGLLAWIFLWLIFFTAPATATDHDLCLDGGSAPPLAGAEFLRSYRAGLHAPSRLAIDGSDNVYISDPARNQLLSRAPDGRVLQRRVFPAQPNAIAIDDQNGRPPTFYVGENSSGRVTAYSVDWAPLRELGEGEGEFLSVSDIVVEPESGAVYVVDSEADLVKIYTPDGALSGSFGGAGDEPGAFDFPAAITIDPLHGEVLVVDQLNFRIQIFDLDGNFICRLGDAAGSSSGSIFVRSRLFSVPQGIAVDAEGRIYVADAAEGWVRVVDRDGVLLGEIGGFGEGPDRLRVPLDLVIDGHNRLFISDSNNGRLMVYGLETFTDPETFAPAEAVVTPDPFDHRGPDEIFTAIIEIPGYPLRDVTLDSITANGVPLIGSAIVGDDDGDREPDLLATFDRTALAATLPPKGLSPIVLQGQMAELDFHATAFITVAGGIVDGDGDGVLDDVDSCPGTAPGGVIDATGCAIAQLCPCGAQSDGLPWATHGEYATCTGVEARRFADAGLIGRVEIGGIVAAAVRAECPGEG